MVVSTWAQVTTPELTGQLVDCYLTPSAGSAFGNFPGISSLVSSSAANCWFAQSGSPAGLTQTLMKNVFTLGGFSGPKTDGSNMDANGRIAGLLRMVLILVGLFVISSALTGLTFFSMTWAGQHVLRSLRIAVFTIYIFCRWVIYAEHEAGDLMSRITNDAVTIEQAINFALVNVVGGVLLLVWIVYNMLTTNVPFALLSVAVAPIMLVATLYFSDQARRLFRKSRKSMGNVNSELQENISAVREVQAFNRAEENIEQFRVTSGDYRDANVSAVAFSAALAPTLQALGYLALAIVTCAGGLALLGNGTLLGTAVSLGMVITFLGYVQRFNQPIQQIAVLWPNIQSAIAGAERIFGLLDETPAIQDAPDATVLPPVRGEVAFVNVTAEYEKGQPVLKDINFKVSPGQTIAIVGPTGAGKTTIVNLLSRFYDVTGGKVLIDGIDIRTVTAESLRRQEGIVLQDTFLFNTTVMENIRFGKPDASDEQVHAAAKLAHADTIYRPPSGEVCDHPRRARLRSQPGTAAVARDRPCRPGRSAHPHPRRGHLECGHPYRKVDPGGFERPAQRAHQFRHRPPFEHDPQRRPGAGGQRWRNHRTRQAQRTAGEEGLLLQPVHEPVPQRRAVHRGARTEPQRA